MSLAQKIGRWTLGTLAATMVPLGGMVLIDRVASVQHVVDYKFIPRENSQFYDKNFIGPLLPLYRAQEYVVLKNELTNATTIRSLFQLPAQISWYDNSGDGIVDKKEFVIASLRPPGVWRFAEPITPEDQDLFTRLVAKARDQH